MNSDQHDWIQDAVIARAERLGLTAYAVAQMTGGKVGPDHVKDFMTRRKSMGSWKLQHVLRALGLTVKPGTSPPTPGLENKEVHPQSEQRPAEQ